MRILWTLLKVALGLMIAVPLAIVALGLTIGVLGAVFALAVIALKLACVGLIAYGTFRIARRMFAPNTPSVPVVRELSTPRDHYYEAAMRELDVELGPTSR